MEAVSTVDRWIFAWCSLTQRARRWQGQLEDTLQPHDLSAVELLVLWRTGHATSPGISQVELSRELSVSAAQVCGVVEALQRRGWLQTTRPPEDRRRLYCHLTPTGDVELQRLLLALLPMAQRCLRDDPATPSINLEEAA